MSRIYLDHNASTPVRREAVLAMAPYFAEHYGNPSSAHAFGQEAKGALDTARGRVAALIGAAPSEIVFTSGGTESDNMAVLGAARALGEQGRHLVVGAIEHEAVLHTAEALEREGFALDLVRPGPDGVVSPDDVARAIRPETILVSVMAANNETGVLQPSAAIGAVCAERGVAYHVDAVQAAGKVAIDVAAWGATMLTITAHKFYGPKGAGALFVKRGFRISPLTHGGEHERGRRPGTENVPAIVGLGVAAELAARELTETPPRIAALRDRLEAGILASVPRVVVHGAGAPRTCNTSHVSIIGAEGEHVLLSLDMKGIACSSGAACKAGSSRPSHVLLAMGVDPGIAQSAVRLSLGRDTSEADVDRVLDVLPSLVAKLRSSSPAVSA